MFWILWINSFEKCYKNSIEVGPLEYGIQHIINNKTFCIGQIDTANVMFDIKT